MKSICKNCKHCTHHEMTSIDTTDSKGFEINWFVEIELICNMTKVHMYDVQKCTGFEKRETK